MSPEGNELQRLVDLICAYEQKDWNSYFEEAPLADDDFMPERLSFDEKETTARGMLSRIPINTVVDEESSRVSALAESSPKQYLLESINKAMTNHPELRLGQLLIDVMILQQPCTELFDIEDNALAKKLNQYTK